MKKQLTTVLLIFALLLTLAGCTAANAARKLDTVEDLVEAKLDAAEEKVEESFRESVNPAPAVPAEVPAQTQPVPTQASPAPAENPQMLTKEQAQKIALGYLGFMADQVTRLHIEYEMDDGIPQFDVQFYQGDWEYEFEIHGESGQILSYDKDYKYD